MIERFTRTPPPLLFRYSGMEVAQKLIADPHFRFSNPSTFNDPFEFRPEIKLRARGAELAEILSYNKLSADASIDKAERALARIVHSDAAKRYHVLCLTEDPLNLLMWAHYGRSHTGCVFGFDSDMFTPFRDLNLTAGPVMYDDARPQVEIPPREDEEDTIRAIFTKGRAWEYEREWRIALTHRDTLHDVEHRPFNFPPQLLRIVIAGARCGREFNQLRDALKANRRLKHVELVHACIDAAGFRLRLKRRDDTPFGIGHFTREFERHRGQRRERGQTWYAEGMRRRAAKGLPTHA